MKQLILSVIMIILCFIKLKTMIKLSQPLHSMQLKGHVFGKRFSNEWTASNQVVLGMVWRYHSVTRVGSVCLSSTDTIFTCPSQHATSFLRLTMLTIAAQRLPLLPTRPRIGRRCGARGRRSQPTAVLGTVPDAGRPAGQLDPLALELVPAAL